MNMRLHLFFHLVSLAYLVLAARSDLKTRTISPLVALALAGTGILVRLLSGTSSPGGLLPLLGGNGVLFLVSFLSRGAIGCGDCLVLLTYGSWVGIDWEAGCLMTGLVYSAVWSAGLLLLKRAGRKDTLPFLPFLLAGHLTLSLLSFFSPPPG